MTFTERALEALLDRWWFYQQKWVENPHPPGYCNRNRLQALAESKRALLVHQRWLRENERRKRMNIGFRSWCHHQECLDSGDDVPTHTELQKYCLQRWTEAYYGDYT